MLIPFPKEVILKERHYLITFSFKLLSIYAHLFLMPYQYKLKTLKTRVTQYIASVNFVSVNKAKCAL